MREGPLRLGLRELAAAADDAAHPARGLLPEGPLSSDVQGEGAGAARKPGGLVDYDEVLPHFREATLGGGARPGRAERLKAIHADGGPGAIAGFGSAKCSNEEAYLFQKLIRAGFGTNNVDHCTRLCHASSVAALFEGVGSGAVSTTYGDIVNADVAILAGTNTTANHPVASSFFKQAKRRGTKLIVVDPRRERIADHADIYCQLKPGTDVAFYNGIMHEVIANGWVDREFIAERTYELRRARRRSRSTRPSAPSRSAASTPTRSARWRGCGARPRRRHLLGHGDLPAHDRHRQRALPDRDVLDHRATSAGRARACTRCAGRTTSRAPPTRADPDVLSRLPAGRRRRRARALRGGGARARPRARA